MNIALRAFWSNNPLPIQEKINKPDVIINLNFGNVLTLTTGVRSINNKTGNVILNAIDVGADSVGAARNVYDELSPKVDALIDNKLDKIDYVQHFRGIFSSYSALSLALPTALDGDYAHIDSGSGFDRMCAIWDRDDNEWRIIAANIASNTDEIPEGSHNLYFQSERVRQTVLTGLSSQTATDILATDSLIIALAKLQAQLKVPPQVKWHKAEDVLIQKVVKTNLYATISGVRFDLEFAKINGMLWMRGAFEVLSSIQMGYTIWTLKPEWRVQSIRVGKVPNYTSLYNVYVPTSPTTENSLYVHSYAVVNSDITVEQDIRALGFLSVSIWGVGGAVCLGALITS